MASMGFTPGPGHRHLGHFATPACLAAGHNTSGHWIAGAIKHPGALHREMGVPAGQKIPAGRLAKAAKAGGVLGRRARLAETLGRMR